MANSRPYPKPQRLVSSSPIQNKNNPRKFYQHIIFKVIIVVLSVVIILVLPSDSPDVENPTIFDRGWELLQLILVGIVVSYGLFSRKNDELDGKNDENEGNFGNGSQSYVSSLLNVTSEVFRDETGNLPSGFVDDDENDDGDDEKIRTWNLEYVRNEAVTVVNDKRGKSEKSCVIDENCGVISGEKPLLLPVRSLKSRVCSENETNGVGRVFTRSLTDPVADESRVDSRVSDEKDGNLVSRVGTRSNRSKSFSTNSRELDGNDCVGYGRSNSSRDAKGFTSDSRIGVGSEQGFVNGDGKIPKSMSKSNSSAKDYSSISRKSISGNDGELNDGKLDEHKEKVEESLVFPSPIPWRSRSGRMVMQGESYDTSSTHSLPPSLEQSEAARLLKKASNYGLHPPPPPPPPPASATNRSRLIKTPQKDLKRNDDESLNRENEESKVKTRNEVELTEAKNSDRRSIDFFEKVLMESDDDESESEDQQAETAKADDNEPLSENVYDSEVPDVDKNVDKKADEFIARFREQIRLQRIDSIKKSTGQLKRNFGR